nr:kinase inhibitor [Escherichia coli]
MKLISNDLRDGDKLPHRHVFNGMGYDGDNISPHLAWDDVPAGTKSFVVTCYDPDAPTGSGWWHWVVVNLPADTRVLPQGFGSGLVAMPDGVLQTRTDFGKTGYDGAAPPKGETHRYIFTVHALDIELKWFTEFGHLNRGDMLTSEQHRCHNEKKKFQRRV